MIVKMSLWQKNRNWLRVPVVYCKAKQALIAMVKTTKSHKLAGADDSGDRNRNVLCIAKQMVM